MLNVANLCRACLDIPTSVQSVNVLICGTAACSCSAATLPSNGVKVHVGCTVKNNPNVTVSGLESPCSFCAGGEPNYWRADPFTAASSEQLGIS